MSHQCSLKSMKKIFQKLGFYSIKNIILWNELPKVNVISLEQVYDSNIFWQL